MTRGVALCAALLVAALAAACATTAGAPAADIDRPPERVPVTAVPDDAHPRVLCVVAHPDDEIAFAGTLYKTAAALGGACDIFTITNGEGGFKYATLAERIYGLELTDETVGRRELPEIRKRELAAGCRRLGVRDVWFLRETDHRYTQDLGEVLGPDAHAWNVERVREQLRRRIAAGGYDFVLVHQPVPDTHAHHKAASILAIETVAEITPERRPVVLGVRVVTEGESAPAPAALPGRPETTPVAHEGPFVFDRRQTFGHQGRLDYRIVVNWAIAEHKSQGTMQLGMNRGDREEYRLFNATRNTLGDADRARAWFDALARPQFAVREYGASAGTNAAPR